MREDFPGRHPLNRFSNSSRFRFAAAFVAAATMLCVWAVTFAAAAPPERINVSVRPITEFHIGHDETRFGTLTFVGGLEMTSGSGDFGSMSAFRFRKPGSDFIGVADTGYWFFGRIDHDAAGRPSGVSDFTMQAMVDAGGNIIGRKWLTDAEGLGIRGDIATAGFERSHRISEFRIDPADMKGPIRDLDFLVPRKELRINRGFETVAYAPEEGPLKGARVIVSEKSLDENGNPFAAILEGPEKGVFSVKRSGEFDITDGAFLPNGDLLLLERSFSYADGVAMQLRRIDGTTLRKGALADGPALLKADMSYQIDNMEGLDVWRREDGALMVSIVSDDNQSLFQRNLYLEFRLDE
jgi:hypothetical protein